MAPRRAIIPTLDDSHIDMLDDDISIIAYLVSFTLINPGLTSEHLEQKILSFSTILASNQDNIPNAAEVYQDKLKELIDINTEDGPYTVDIEVVNDEEYGNNDTNVKFIIRVLDSNGDNVFTKNHMLKALKKDVIDE